MFSLSLNVSALILSASLASPVAAFWRMPCPGRLILERIDPIISPFSVSGHVHTVSGGSGFGFNTTYGQQFNSACSSCPIEADKSAYWTPKLYVTNQDYTLFQDVPQAGEGSGATGGLTVYYQQRVTSNLPEYSVQQAFPEGFRMVAGNPFQRNYTGLQAAPGSAVSYACLDYNAPASPQTNSIPNRNCPDGLRAQIYFPSCWNGVDLDPPDHSSHMAYPVGQADNGVCPDTHPVPMISIFYEVIYQIDNFANYWWDPNQHPFVFAMGDRTGHGFHGDFVNGWDVSILQTAVEECTNLSGSLSDCPVFTDLYTDDECQACRLPNSVDEPITGNLTALPGCNPVNSGPEMAVPPATCAATTVIGPATQAFTDETSLGWEYLGCATDSVSSRTLSGHSTAGDDMTIESCINSCSSAGFSLAGLEYATQCWCGDDFPAGTAPSPNILGNCAMPCGGDSSQICGGAAALSVYRNCAGGPCTNAVFTLNGTAVAV